MQTTLRTFPRCSHPMNEANSYIDPGGKHVRCRICRKERHAAYKARQPVQTHCRNGHELTPDNVRITPRGRRTCRQCERDSHHRQRSAAKSDRPHTSDPAAELHPVRAKFWGIDLPEHLERESTAYQVVWVARAFYRVRLVYPTVVILPAGLTRPDISALQDTKVRHARPGELGDRDENLFWVR